MAKNRKTEEKKSIMFLDQDRNVDNKLNLNLSRFSNWRNVRNPDLANALTIGGATLLGSAGLSSINTALNQKRGKRSVYEQYIQDQGGQDFIDKCSTGNCPGITYYNPDQEWFYTAADRAGDMWENQGYWSGSASQGTINDWSAYKAVQEGERQGTILSQKDLNKKYLQNIGKGIKHGVITGGTSYLLNKALDNTRFGRRLQNKLGMDINLGIYRKNGGPKTLKFGAGKKSVTNEEFANMSSLDRNRLLGISRGGGRAGNYTGVRVEERQPQKRKKFLGLFKDGGVKKYATAGMYDANVIPGSLNSTTNIVMQQSDPSVLLQNQQGLTATVDKLQQKGNEISTEIGNIEAQENANIQDAVNKVEGRFTAGEQTLSKGLNFANKQGWLDGLKSGSSLTGTGTTGGLGNISLIDKSSKLFQPLNTTPTSQLLSPSTFTPKTFSTGLDLSGSSLLNPTTTGSTNLLGTGTDLLSSSLSTGADAASKWAGFGKKGMEFSKLAQAGKLGKLGAGAGKFLTSGAGLGTVASLAGQGISRFSEEGDPTKSNVGEYSGAILSGAGTGASIGSIIPGIGTAVGAVAGALYGAGKQFFGTKAAQKAKQEAVAKRRAKQEEYNELLDDQMGSQLAQVRSGEMEQKTYSGYDLGRNVTYGLGGLKMPRYGY